MTSYHMSHSAKPVTGEEMKVLSYPDFSRLEISRRPCPALEPHEVLLRVAACGVCGSELETFRNRSPRRKPPLVMGHEFCGTIADIGPGVEGFTPGQPVISNSIVSCGTCVRCRRGDTHLCGSRQIFGMHRPGAFAQFVNVPASCLIPWPSGVPAQAACLAEPLANGIHVVNLTRQLAPKNVLVIGAGPIGLQCQQAFQALTPAEVWIADLAAERLEVAARLGARRTLYARTVDVVQACLEATKGEGMDLVIDAVGSSQTKKQSLQALRPGGAAVWIGLHEDSLTLDSYSITLPEKKVYGTYAATLDELRLAVQLMADKKVDMISWVTTSPLELGVEAFHGVLVPNTRLIKAVLLP